MPLSKPQLDSIATHKRQFETAIAAGRFSANDAQTAETALTPPWQQPDVRDAITSWQDILRSVKRTDSSAYPAALQEYMREMTGLFSLETAPLKADDSRFPPEYMFNNVSSGRISLKDLIPLDLLLPDMEQDQDLLTLLRTVTRQALRRIIANGHHLGMNSMTTLVEPAVNFFKPGSEAGDEKETSLAGIANTVLQLGQMTDGWRLADAAVPLGSALMFGALLTPVAAIAGIAIPFLPATMLSHMKQTRPREWLSRSLPFRSLLTDLQNLARRAETLSLLSAPAAANDNWENTQRALEASLCSSSITVTNYNALCKQALRVLAGEEGDGRLEKYRLYLNWQTQAIAKLDMWHPQSAMILGGELDVSVDGAADGHQHSLGLNIQALFPPFLLQETELDQPPLLAALKAATKYMLTYIVCTELKTNRGEGEEDGSNLPLRRNLLLRKLRQQIQQAKTVLGIDRALDQLLNFKAFSMDHPRPFAEYPFAIALSQSLRSVSSMLKEEEASTETDSVEAAAKDTSGKPAALEMTEKKKLPNTTSKQATEPPPPSVTTETAAPPAARAADANVPNPNPETNPDTVTARLGQLPNPNQFPLPTLSDSPVTITGARGSQEGTQEAPTEKIAMPFTG